MMDSGAIGNITSARPLSFLNCNGRFDAVPAGIIGVGELVVADDVSSTPNGPAKRAVDKWIGSIEHKALLLRPDMFVMGCSTAQGSDGRFYATAIVGSK